MTKIDKNLIRQSTGQGQQLCPKWKKSKKLFKGYRVNKNLRPPAPAYEQVQKHKVTPCIPGLITVTKAEYKSEILLTKDTPYLPLMGELWGDCSEE